MLTLDFILSVVIRVLLLIDCQINFMDCITVLKLAEKYTRKNLEKIYAVYQH